MGWYTAKQPVHAHTGSLEADDSSAAGDLPPTVKSIKWAYSTRPIYGWGDTGVDQKSTAGWLAAMPVFEPHWQASCLLQYRLSALLRYLHCSFTVEFPLKCMLKMLREVNRAVLSSCRAWSACLNCCFAA